MTDDDTSKPVAEAPSAAFVRVQTIIATLEKDKLLELKKKANREALAEAMMEELTKLAGTKDVGAAVTEWLMDRDEVVDVFGSDEEIDAILRRA